MSARAPAAHPTCPPAVESSGGAVRLLEKPFSDKLEALYKSRSYQLAAAVAETEQARAWGRSRPRPRVLCWPDSAGSGSLAPCAWLAASCSCALSPACAVHLALPPCPCPLPPPQVDAATLAGIRRQYADFLYAKRDYDQAMEQ